MEFRGQIYNTLADWTSKEYANPIETTHNNFILVELKGFESELLEVGFNFITLDKSIIKIAELS